MFSGSAILYLVLIILFFNIARGQLPPIVTQLLTDPIIGISFILGLIVGITIHEFSHALVAYRLGDPTAKLAGRLNLNPMSHLDPVGTLMLLIVGFGWGKPTPFDPYNLRNIKRDSALISVAGAFSNLLLATIVASPYFIAYYTNHMSQAISNAYIYISPFIYVNLILAVFNLIPISPLDGFKVLAGLLPRDWYEEFMQTEPYGIFILLILLATGLVGRILLPVTSTLANFLLPHLSLLF